MLTYDEFNDQLKLCDDGDVEDFIKVNIIDIVPAVFEGNEIKYERFRKRIAKKFNVEASCVHIVGSATVGFSYRKAGKVFSLASDVDVAIVSEELFEEYSRILAEYHYDIIHHRIPLARHQRKRYYAFLEYYAVGWLRPDKGTDIMNKHPLVDDWWSYFRSISYDKSEIGNYKVNAGIYKSMHYLYQYQKIGILNHKKGII